MGKRGPQPITKLAVVKPTKKQHTSPPIGMTKKARNVWNRIVQAYPYDHFKPQHYDQLRAYCEAAALNKYAAMEASRVNYTDINKLSGAIKTSHWVEIMDKMAGRMQGLAVKLGITKNNTLVAKGVTGEKPTPESKRKGLMFGK